MGKLMKYEIKGSYRFILGVLALVMILTSGIYIYMNNAMQNDATVLGGMFIGLSFMVIFGTMLATFFYIVNLFRKELYEDRGYLTFTLPLSGRQILGSKLLVALLWFGILGLGVMISNGIGLRFIVPNEIWQEIPFAEIFSQISISTLVFGLLYGLLGGVVTLITIYFAMALGRVSFKNKKMGGIWFVIFLVLSLIISFGQLKAAELIPHYLNLGNPGLESFDSAVTTMDMSIHVDVSGSIPTITNNMNGDILINIGALLYNIIIAIAGFLGTSYLIERKIDI